MNSIPQKFSKNLLSWSVVGVAFTCSACATNSQTVRSNSPESGALQAIYKETTVDPKAARKTRSADNQQQNSAMPSGVGQQIHRDPSFQQIAYTDTEGAVGSNVANAGGLPSPQFPPQIQNIGYSSGAIQSCPPEPRLPAAGFNPMAPGMMANEVVNLPSPENYSDECLCDGGDRDLPVHYDAANRRSLDTEDTVLEFTDRDGIERVKPSNRVCVYAPRFASVRTVSRPHEELSTNEVAGVGQLASLQGIHSRLRITHADQREMMSGVTVRSRAGGLESEAFPDTISQLRSLSMHEKLLNLFEALSFVRSGKIEETETAQLSKGIQAASSWTREQYPVISSKTDMAIEGRFEQSVSSITVVEEKEEAENLRIVKLADKQTAVTGDVIEFTIRYDNLGGREVHHIRIVDNLTPRLAYVNDSATSDRDGRLVLQDNGEGSQILIWELEAPLKGKSGGVVTFKARVR